MSITAEVRRLRSEGLSIDDICERIDTPRHEILRICRKAGMAITKEESTKAKQRQAEQFAHDEEWAKEYVLRMSDNRYEYVSGYQNMDKPLRMRCVKCGEIRDINCKVLRQQKWRGKTVRCNICYFTETEERKEKRKAEKQEANLKQKQEAKLKRIINSPCKQMSFSFCGCGVLKNPRARMCPECARKAGNKNKEITRRAKIQSAMVDKDITLDRVYQRDKGICYLCGELCDWDDYITTDKTIIAGNMYPSIDHVKPLARGGFHSWENVRLAHRYCNSVKSDRIENETA